MINLSRSCPAGFLYYQTIIFSSWRNRPSFRFLPLAQPEEASIRDGALSLLQLWKWSLASRFSIKPRCIVGIGYRMSLLRNTTLIAENTKLNPVSLRLFVQHRILFTLACTSDWVTSLVILGRSCREGSLCKVNNGDSSVVSINLVMKIHPKCFWKLLKNGEDIQHTTPWSKQHPNGSLQQPLRQD